MSKHFHLPKTDITMSDIFVFITIALFIAFVDVVYLIIHYSLGIQISDYWLVCNVIFYSVELLCLAIISVVKKLKPDQKEAYKEIAGEISKGVAEGVVSHIIDGFQMPAMTSGEHSIKRDIVQEESDVVQEEEYMENDEDESVG